jgi:DNA polymerase III sliding clamp (beta) subunit (PCNA family)
MKILMAFIIIFFIINTDAVATAVSVAAHKRQIVSSRQAVSILSAIMMPGKKKIRYGYLPPENFETLDKEINPSRFALFSVHFSNVLR